jgi:hypothetical protein
MKSTTVIIFASIVVVTGRWARHKEVDTSIVVGGIMLALLIQIMSAANEPLAEKFSWLILFAVLGSNAEDLMKAVGVVTGKADAAAVNADPASASHTSILNNGGKLIPTV